MHRFKAKRLLALDGLRGLAILLVIAHHQLIPIPITGGFLGVDLFFVLSGFLITSLLVEEFDATGGISLRHFYTRRILRLAPALALYLVVTLAVILRTNRAQFLEALKSVGFALTYMTNWRMAFSSSPPLDPTAIIWSLSIEEQFYILWPPTLLALMLLRVKRSHLIAGLTLLIATIAMHRYILWTHRVDLHRLYYGTDTRADAPLLGCLIALIPLKLSNPKLVRIFQAGGVVAAVGLGLLVIEMDFSNQFLYRGGYTLVALLAALLTWTTVNAPLQYFSHLLEWSPLRWLGKISYGLYLWHWLLLQTTTFYALFGSWDPWVRFIVALGVSAACFYLIERPFNLLKRKFGYARSKSSAVSRFSQTSIRRGASLMGQTSVITSIE